MPHGGGGARGWARDAPQRPARHRPRRGGDVGTHQLRAGSRMTSSVLRRSTSTVDALLPVLSVVVALGLWEAISRTGVIDERDLPAMSTCVRALWRLVETGAFWHELLLTVRGWALGLGVAAALAIPLGVLLGSSDLAGRAFRVPIEFLRPIPSAALIPLLFLTLGTNLKSEVFLAAFGAFWPLLVQTMYGVRDVDPVALDTARSFGLGP